MPSLPNANPLPVRRRLARGLYWRFLSLSFRTGKGIRSAVFNWFRPQAPWPGHDAVWENLDDFAEWLARNTRWTADPLNGAIDIFPNRATIAAQFQNKGIYEDDCDGLAYLSAQSLPRIVENPDRIYIVTLILDPYTFKTNPLLYAAHVICIFQHEGDWRVISNSSLYPQRFPSFAAAIQQNPYTAAHPILWAEIRGRDLDLLFSGRDVTRFQA